MNESEALIHRIAYLESFVCSLKETIEQQKKQLASAYQTIEQYRNFNKRDFKDRNDYLDYEEGIDRS